MRYAYSDQYKYLSDILLAAANEISLINKMSEEIHSFSDEDKYSASVAELLACAEKHYSLASAVLKLFDKEHIYEYISINRCLELTAIQISRNNELLGKKIILRNRIIHRVARMNYSVFEVALSCIARILYRAMQNGSETELFIDEKSDGYISVSCDYRNDSGADITVNDQDIGLMKCAFGCLNGESRIIYTGNTLRIRGFLPASLSNYIRRIRDNTLPYNEYYSADELKGFGYILAVEDDRTPEFSSKKKKYSPMLAMVLWDIAMKELYHGMSDIT